MADTDELDTVGLVVTEMKVRVSLEMGPFLRRDDWMKKDSVGQIPGQWSFPASGSQLLPPVATCNSLS